MTAHSLFASIVVKANDAYGGPRKKVGSINKAQDGTRARKER